MITSAVHVRIVLCALLWTACDETSTSGPEAGDGSYSPQEDAATTSKDSGADARTQVPDASTVPDPTGSDNDAGVDPTGDGGTGCDRDRDCDDGFACNGEETCIAGECQRGMPPRCSLQHPCTEPLGACDCTDPDEDQDDSIAKECGGDDCDDGDWRINPKAFEFCDANHQDEDCNPATFRDATNPRDGDGDGDTYYSDRCYNIDPDTGAKHAGDDCNDENPSIHPGASEVCDYADNNCNNVVDEALDAQGRELAEPDGLRLTYYPDRDRDGCGDRSADPIRLCEFTQPPGYIAQVEPCDCDDSPATGDKVNIHAPEICDNRDNDCDGLVDADDTEDLVQPYHLEHTVFACRGGRWVIDDCPADLKWCNKTTVDFGCETDARRLSSCRACETNCDFACGQLGCDEIEAVSLGNEHSCAVTLEKRVACWGRGGSGRLGNDSTAASSVATLVAGIDGVSAISASVDHTCVVARSDGAVYCWGNNLSLQLGNADGGDFSAVPIEVRGVDTDELTNAKQVAAGPQNSCALLASGQVACWGLLDGGRLADGGGGDTGAISAIYAQRIVNQRVRDVDDAAGIALGSVHGCLYTTRGTVECWGDNRYGQLGADSTVTQSSVARPVPDLVDVTALAAGTYHTCAISGGHVFCWGSNDSLQLGRTTNGDNAVPAQVPGISDAVDIAAGLYYSCAVTSGGQLYCWGANANGQFGVPTETIDQSVIPVLVPIDNVTRVSAADHICVVASNAKHTGKRVFCWGTNSFGQCGNGQISTSVPSPTLIHPLADSRP